MNKILLLSSTILGMVQLVYIYILLQFHFYFSCVAVGVVTSIVNHGSNSDWMKLTDRFAMFILFHYNLYLVIDLKLMYCLIWLVKSIVFYFLGKYYETHWLHVASHICISINNILIGWCYFEQSNQYKLL